VVPGIPGAGLKPMTGRNRLIRIGLRAELNWQQDGVCLRRPELKHEDYE